VHAALIPVCLLLLGDQARAADSHVIAVSVPPEQTCPAPRQITDALAARLPGVVLPQGQPVKPGMLRLTVATDANGGIRIDLADPEGALAHMWSCVAPGGDLLLWCYAKEGNRLMLPVIQSLRAVGSRLPIGATHAVAKGITALAWPAIRALPFRTDYYRRLRTLSFRNVESIIFDQMLPRIANYWTRADMQRLAGAAFGMIPVGLVIASIGYLLAGWLRTRAVTGILIAFVFASFVLTLLVPLFRWPPALLQLSIFEQYGAPLVDGLQRGRALGLLAVATATLAAAVVRFERKDLTA
jgi:hypothetical protein